MNTEEYRRKTHPKHYRRSWPFTIIAAILGLLVLYGIIQAWRHLEHDLYLICTIIIPAVLVDLALFLVAINGRKPVIKSAFGSILEMLFFWP